MLLVDDILLAPFTGILALCREIQRAAEQELRNEMAAITAKLGDLYTMLESGKITEAEFDASEQTLLQRLDPLHGQGDEVDTAVPAPTVQ